MKKILSFAYFFLCTALLFTISASAYIDPSAMTYIIQLIAGVAIAAGAAFGFYFRKIKRAFSKMKKNDDVQVDWDDDDDDDDFGYDEYDLDDYDTDDAVSAPASAPAATAPSYAAPSNAVPAAAPVYSAPIEVNPADTDKYDESGAASLAAENRELRRLLAEEREKVAILKKALSICSNDR